MKYERLTKKDWHEAKFDCIDQNKKRATLKRLWELENQIENGTLIELPCKVGDTVYYKTFARNGKQSMGIQGHEVLGIRVLVMTKNNYGDMWTEIPLSCFGKDVFLTKEQTEKKLKELQNVQT